MMTAETNHAEQNARSWMETISEHIACMNADRKRLEELRDERETWVINDGGDVDEQNRTPAEWVKEFPDEAEELAELTMAVTVDGEELDEDAIHERIQESPLSVEVRGDWHAPGEEDEGPSEFNILLSTGGPALRIIGDLDANREPTRARLQYQDWGTPWTELVDVDHDDLLAWCCVFYFGE